MGPTISWLFPSIRPTKCYFISLRDSDVFIFRFMCSLRSLAIFAAVALCHEIKHLHLFLGKGPLEGLAKIELLEC